MQTAILGSRWSGSGAGLFAGLIRRMEAERRARSERLRIMRELETYSDRELRDLGICRGDIPDIARGRFRRP